MRKLLLSLLTLLAVTLPSAAQTKMIRDFKPAADSLKARMERRSGVKVPVRISKVMDRSGVLDFYFTSDLAEFPWHEGDYEWFTNEFKKLFPSGYSHYTLGDVYSERRLIKDMQMPLVTSDGKPRQNGYRVKDQRQKTVPLVTDIDAPIFDRGLSGRHIALWQSHGRYYNDSHERWLWQRAPLHGTMEDLFTQSFVIPFLIPMLENAGAVVITPRERDTQVYEVVCDNDPAFQGFRPRNVRRIGNYMEKGSWNDAGIGFADKKEVYSGNDNPFTMGTARSTQVHKESNAVIRWTPDFMDRGEYAVYVSYKTLSNSTTCASYSVHHAGGVSRFSVNQTMSGSTWVYLGTFTFEKGRKGYVELDNGVPDGRSYKDNTVVTADAVRFGGGMGKYDAGGGISGLPAYEEGALYNLQWSGFDRSLFDWDTEYQREYGSRAIWVNQMCGSSRVNPSSRGRGVPFDLSLAFHTNAGVKPDKEFYGTLAIVQTERNDKTTLPSGENRMSSRMMADLIQSQIVDDVRSRWEPYWTRYALHDRSYHEAGAPVVPAMILEAFSHQNFADMTCGLNPAFRFDLSRAVYKGMLKYLSYRYGCNYTVQPLPVESFSATISGDKVILSWNAVNDALEPTAKPKDFILYTREGDGAFDRGTVLENVHKNGTRCTAEIPLVKGKLMSYRIAAMNEGGRSFPSEVLCVGVPSGESKHKVLVVNNFTRVSPPAWVDLPNYGGFMYQLDGGVGWGDDLTFAGEVYQFEKGIAWDSDDNPGTGGCYTDNEGGKLRGNTFDFAAVHGRALFDAGYSVISTSASAISLVDTTGIWALDLICGEQLTTPVGRNRHHRDRYEVFPQYLRAAIKGYQSRGTHVLVSGAYIGTDVWDKVFQIGKKDESVREEVSDMFGYAWITNFADRSGQVRPFGRGPSMPETRYNKEYVSDVYRVENADGIGPARDGAVSIMRYRGTDISAAVAFDNGTSRTLSFGFPLETIVSEGGLSPIIQSSLEYFEGFVKNE